VRGNAELVGQMASDFDERYLICLTNFKPEKSGFS
jgi:hypothetical protein